MSALDMFADFLQKIAARSPSKEYFFGLWQGALYRCAREGNLHGCPLMNLNAEPGNERVKFRDEVYLQVYMLYGDKEMLQGMADDMLQILN